MEVLLFAFVLLVSLFLIPLGLPGTWIMVGSAIGYDAIVGGNPIGWVTIAGTAVLAGSKLSAVPMIAPVFASQNGRCRFQVLSVANPTIKPRLLIAKALDADPPGSSPKSVIVICRPPTIYVIEVAAPSLVITQIAKPMAAT